MTDPRVEILARAVWDTHRVVDRPYDVLGDDIAKRWADEDAAAILTAVEAAGLLVLAGNDATLNKIASVWTSDDDRLPLSVRYRYARAIVAALRSSPPADFPTAGGAPGYTFTNCTCEPERTHDGVRADKAIRTRGTS